VKRTMQRKKWAVKRDVSKKTPAAVLTTFGLGGLRWMVIWVERRFIISPFKIQHKYRKPSSFPVQRQHRYFGFFFISINTTVYYWYEIGRSSIVQAYLVYNILYKIALAVRTAVHHQNISTTFIVLENVFLLYTLISCLSFKF